jgi:hypothetical protein
MAEKLAGPSFYSYNLTVETKVNIDELIYVLSPQDLPLLTGVGSDGNVLLPRTPVDNITFSWLEEEVPLPRATLNTTVNDSTTSIIVNSGEGVKFAVGDAILIDSEVMLVTAINTSTDTLTVTRGSASETNTTAASHTAGAEVVGIGTVLVEGSIGSSTFQGRDKYSNYTQIWSRKIQVSRTEQRIPKYGVPNELNRQMMNNVQALNLGIEQAALYGVKHEVSATKRRQTGGLASFITTNHDSTNTWLTVDAIEDRLQVAYNNGGMFDYIMAQPAAFQALNNTTGNERVQTVTVEDIRRGRRRAQIVMTEFGDIELVRNRWVKKTDAFGCNRENFIFRVFQPLVTEKLAKTDDTDTYMMVCEGGFEIKGQAHMAKWSALDTSSALPGSGLV